MNIWKILIYFISILFIIKYAYGQEVLLVPSQIDRYCMKTDYFLNSFVGSDFKSLVSGLSDYNSLTTMWINIKNNDWLISDRFPSGTDALKGDYTCIFIKGTSAASAG